MSERDLEMKAVPYQKADKATWPKGVRQITVGEFEALGIDASGNLYWHGKRVQTRAQVNLTPSQIVYAVIIAIATVAGACGAVAQGWAAYNEWACKVRWPAVCVTQPPK